MDLETTCTIKCPECGFEKQEEMPVEACAYFYECTSCHKVIRPKQGDCCVFCSYGSVACPSRQAKNQADPSTKKPVFFGLLGAVISSVIASACCLGPAILLSLGIGSAWMSHISVIAAYRPYFIGLALLFLAFSFYKLYIAAPTKCDIGQSCDTPRSLHVQRVLFWITTIIIFALILVPLIVG